MGRRSDAEEQRLPSPVPNCQTFEMTDSVLIGREEETARLDRLVTGLLSGRGGALVVDGAAGIGKSTLLEQLQLRAGRLGVRVLLASGVQSEAQLAFASLRDLLTPLLDDVSQLPARQAQALESALAISAPRPGDRLVVCAATDALIVRASVHQPLLLVVDDLQWLDPSSLECVLFAARRATGRVAFLLAGRDEQPTVHDAGLPVMPVTGLTRSHAQQVLSALAPELSTAVASTVLDAADGNPLALSELAHTLGPAQRRGPASLPVPLSPGPRLAGVYHQRLVALSEQTRAVLVLAASYAGDQLRVIDAACTAAHLDVRALAEAEANGLIRLEGGRLRFRHPVLREAVYHDHPAATRRRAHGALAAVLHGEERAAHLAMATVVPDEAVAAEIESAGRSAWSRRSPALAAALLERAARLTTDSGLWVRRLATAGEAAAAAGLPERAIALLTEAGTEADVEGGDGSARTTIRHTLALSLYLSGAPAKALDLLEAESAHVGQSGPIQAARMLAEAAVIAGSTAQCKRALDLAERSHRLLGATAGPADRTQVLAAYGWALSMRGRAEQARSVLAEVDSLSETIDPLGETGLMVDQSLYLRLWSGELERALDEALTKIGLARSYGAVSALPVNLLTVADCCYRLGEWDRAAAAAAEAIRSAHEVGQPALAAYAQVVAARLGAARGDEESSRASLTSMLEVAEVTGARSGIVITRAALGFLELGVGQVTVATDQLEMVALMVAESGMEEPTQIPWEADLVECYLRAGRRSDALATLEIMGRRAELSGVAPARALHARCSAMTHDDETSFEEALRHDDMRPMPFERARTLLAFGRQLRQHGRPAEARVHLHAAVSHFQDLGASPWTTQAGAELRLAGGRRSATGTSSKLTEAEQRVAECVARGLSNREVATELYLSVKTVEFHLSRIFRKLDIGSRSHLIATVARH